MTKANNHRCCAVEDCEWCDNNRDYGTYVKGKYYCAKHGKESSLEEKIVLNKT